MANYSINCLSHNYSELTKESSRPWTHPVTFSLGPPPYPLPKWVRINIGIIMTEAATNDRNIKTDKKCK